MKIYFGFTVAGDRSTLETARSMVRWLEGLGHEVLTRHLVSDDARAADRLLGPQAVYRRDMAWLRECDLFIAEVSGSSFGMGFEAGYLLGATQNKIILFYSLTSRDKISFIITGNTHPNCTLVPYSTLAEVEAFLKTHVGRAASPQGASRE
ncbi:MAG: nucleoside 2-deoxyribosyltransferase [Terriglobia bacterium]